MQAVTHLFDFIMHIDQHLATMTSSYGGYIYLALFLIIFIETGVVVFPFLPGDSLLFAAGALAALPKNDLRLTFLFGIMVVAAILGDSFNYYIGNKLGNNALDNRFLSKVINEEKMTKAENFFKKHGGKTIFFGRFMPFIRTFVPFIAGASKMHYNHFLLYNLLGAFSWVFLGLGAGYFFGNISFVQEHFSMVVLAIILISLLPVLITNIKQRRTEKEQA